MRKTILNLTAIKAILTTVFIAFQYMGVANKKETTITKNEIVKR